MFVELIEKASDVLTKSRLLGRLRIVLQPYIRFIPAVIKSQVLPQRANVLVPLKQAETILKSGTSVFGPDGLDVIAKARPPKVDEAI